MSNKHKKKNEEANIEHEDSSLISHLYKITFLTLYMYNTSTIQEQTNLSIENFNFFSFFIYLMQIYFVS